MGIASLHKTRYWRSNDATTGGTTLVLLAALAFVISSCSSGPPTHGSTQILRELAGRHRLSIGAAVDYEAFRSDPDYRRVLATDFDMLTPENVTKWAVIHPAPDTYDFGPADDLMAFAHRHGMEVRGHNLVWANNNPPWLQHGSWTSAQLADILRSHIQTVVGHFRGRVAQWDVVNEAVDGRGSLRNSIWRRVLGPVYAALAFQWAHQADPKALLFDNESVTSGGPSAQNDGIVRFVAGLRRRGVPISGVGLEMHLSLSSARIARLPQLIGRLNALGLTVAITEMDVALPDASWRADLAKQARIYRDVLEACLSAANCHTFVTWGFTDRYSWVPGAHPGLGHALPLDDGYLPKPAYKSVVEVLQTG